MDVNCEDHPKEKMEQNGDRSRIAFHIVFYCAIVLIVGATVYFFVVRWSQKKPLFITVVFTLLNIMWPLKLIEILCLPQTVQVGTLAYGYYIFGRLVVELIILEVHWIFAIKYLEVAIRTPVFLKSTTMG